MKSMDAQNRFDDEGSAAVADSCLFPPSSPREKYSDKRQAALAQRLFVVARVQKSLNTWRNNENTSQAVMARPCWVCEVEDDDNEMVTRENE